MKNGPFAYQEIRWLSKVFFCITSLMSAIYVQAQVTVISDFNDGIADWDSGPNKPQVTAFEANGRLIIRGQLPATMGDLGNSIGGITWNRDRPIRDGETLETRVELIGTSRSDVIAGMDYNATATSDLALYAMLKSADFIRLDKVLFSPTVPHIPLQVAVFINDHQAIKHTNVVLCLALTGIGPSVRITIKVLDMDNENAVLYERSFLDTPAVDATVMDPLITNEGPDPGPPITMGTYTYLYINQFTDGLQPVAEVTFDNFVYEYRNAVELTIERAVRLSWPAFSTPHVVEGAPSVDGPWTLVPEPIFQTNFMNWMTVPVPLSQSMQVFRLRKPTP